MRFGPVKRKRPRLTYDRSVQASGLFAPWVAVSIPSQDSVITFGSFSAARAGTSSSSANVVVSTRWPIALHGTWVKAKALASPDWPIKQIRFWVPNRAEGRRDTSRWPFLGLLRNFICLLRAGGLLLSGKRP
jgi:hypothetical protein